MVIFAVWPICTFGMLVSSTSTSAWMTRHVGERQQHRAGVVHRADHRRFAFLDVAARDDAVDRRFDADLAQVVAGALERRALLVDPALLRRRSASRAPAAPTRRPCTSFSAFSSASRVVSCCFQRSCWRARFCCACIELHARGLDRLPHLRRATPAPPAATRLPLSTRVRSDFGSICSRNWPILTRSPSLTARFDDAARRVGADVDQPLRLDLARRRHDRFEIARLDRVGGDGEALVLLVIEVRRDDGPRRRGRRR